MWALTATSYMWLTEEQVARRSGLPAALVPALVAGGLRDDGRARSHEVALMRAQVAATMLASGIRWGFVCAAMMQARGCDAETVCEMRHRWRALATQRQRGLSPAAGLAL